MMLKEFFTWSKKERTGVIVLSITLILMIGGDVFFDRIFSKNTPTIHPDTLVHYQKLLHELENELELSSNKVESKEQINKNEKRLIAKKLSFFDPNDLSIKDWENLGFSEKQALSILKYKKQLNGFKTKEELAKSYVISEAKYEELKPYVKIKINELEQVDEQDNAIAEYKGEKVSERIFLDLNSADSISLLRLNGIGPFYASKIIEYRNELGAYVQIEQLLEIWKFDSLKLANIAENIWVDTNGVRKLKINSDSIESLKEHPYIDWNHARAIINYREQHGSYESKHDLLKIVIFEDSLLNKLYPYISLD